MNRQLLLLVTLVLAVGITVPLHAAEAPRIKLRLAGVFPPPSVSMVSQLAQMWMDEVTKKTNGRVTFQAFWGSAMGTASEHLDLVQKGVVDIALTNLQFTPGKLPLAQYEYVFPFGPLDPVIVAKAKRRIYEEFPQFAADLAKYNCILLFNAGGTVYQLMSKTPVRTLEDFKGKKVSLVGRYFGKWFEPIGAVPVVASAPDRYTMLQTGVVDMDLLPIDYFESYKIYEQAPNLITVDALMGYFLDLIMNINSFKKLPLDIQQIFVETGKAMELKMAEQVIPEWSKRVLADFEKKKVNIIQFPKEEREKWIKMLPDIPAEWAKEVTAQGYPGWEIVDKFQAYTAELGFKWPRKWGVRNDSKK